MPYYRAKQLFKHFKSHLQSLRLSCGKWLLDRMPASTNLNLSPENIHSILFLRHDGKIGDYIVSSFVFREIKKSNPKIHIGLICNTNNQYLFTNNPYIDHLYTVRPKSIFSYWKIGNALSGEYDVVIDPTLLLRNRDLLLLRVLNAKYTIGLLKSDYHLFNLNINQADLHFSEVYRQALLLCGFTQIDCHYDIPSSPSIASTIKYFLKENGLTHYIAVNFFGASRSRRFSPDNIRHYLHYFATQFPTHRFVLLSTPEYNAMLHEYSHNIENCFLYETHNIQETIELIRYSDTVFSPDTAIIHIAAGLEKNIVALYQNNPQNMANWHPNSPHSQILFYQTNINEITPTDIHPLLTKFME